EDPEIAALMNRHFVCVKVDREERPDVDQIYMQAVQSMTGHGGWPMTVFLTPEGEPFYGGTYFPPVERHGLPGFPRLLQALAEAWANRRGEVTASARQIGEALTQADRLLARPSSSPTRSCSAPSRRSRPSSTRGRAGSGARRSFPSR